MVSVVDDMYATGNMYRFVNQTSNTTKNSKLEKLATFVLIDCMSRRREHFLDTSTNFLLLLALPEAIMHVYIMDDSHLTSKRSGFL